MNTRYEKLDEAVRTLAREHGSANVVASLARLFRSPDRQYHEQRVMATCFRRLNAVYEYIKKASET